MNPITIVDPLEYPNWDELLLTNDQSIFFHTSAWARVLHESYKYKPLYFVSIKDGNLETLIPIMGIKSFITGKRGVSLPFTDFCPLIAPNKESFHDVINCIKEYGKKAGWKYVEFRGGENYFKDEPASSTYYTHDLDLSQGEESILSSFRNSTRRNIKKAIKEDVHVQISNDLDSVKEFYKLNCVTRNRHSIPPQPYRFFKKLHEHILSKKGGVVILATYKSRAMAGAIFFHFRKKAIFKFGASEIEYQDLRANNLVMWEAIKWCLHKGGTTLNLGRSEPENGGLLQFKRGWGVKEERINYYKYDLTKNTFVKDRPTSKMSYRICKMLPLPLLNLTGSLLYKHVG